MKKNYIFLAPGFEELEALTVVDVMRRAGLDIVMVSIDDTDYVTGAHGVAFQADALYTEVNFNDADWLILPGGLPGATNLHEFEPLNNLLKSHYADGGNIAAICASPAVVLSPLGILEGHIATCYPGFENICEAQGARMLNQYVVADGNVVTGQGPAAALPFALEIVKLAAGDDKSKEVADGMLYK